jgi:hypothetical protein
MSSLDANHRRNIESTIDALCGSLCTAWSYLLLLRSLRDAVHQRPLMNKRFGSIINQYWQALWDALFARIGTFYDRTSGTHSLPTLLTLLRRTKVPGFIALALTAQSLVNDPGESAKRILRWRNEVIGHRVASLVAPQFDEEARLHLDDVKVVLEQLENCLNALSLGSIGVTTDIQHWNDTFGRDASSFLESIEASLVATVSFSKLANDA